MFSIIDFDGNKITWKDGKFTSNNAKLLNSIRKYAKELSKGGYGVYLDGFLLGGYVGCNYEKDAYKAFALLDACMDIKEVEGHRPSISDLCTDKDKDIFY